MQEVVLVILGFMDIKALLAWAAAMTSGMFRSVSVSCNLRVGLSETCFAYTNNYEKVVTLVII